MNHVEQFRRSINIWKVSDKEKEAVNIYVEMYLWIDDLFKSLSEHKEKYLITYKLNNDIYIKDGFGAIKISYNKVYSKFSNRFTYLNYYDDKMNIFKEYFNTTKTILYGDF